MIRYFWTLFFLGSLIAVAADVHERRQSLNSPDTTLSSGEARTLETDPYSGPTPRP